MLFFVKSDSCDVIAFLGVILLYFWSNAFWSKSVGRIFLGGRTGGFFSKFFRRGSESGEIFIFPLKTKKNIIYWKFQNPGGEAPPCLPLRRPWTQCGPIIALHTIRTKTFRRCLAECYWLHTEAWVCVLMLVLFNQSLCEQLSCNILKKFQLKWAP